MTIAIWLVAASVSGDRAVSVGGGGADLRLANCLSRLEGLPLLQAGTFPLLAAAQEAKPLPRVPR